MKKDKFLNNDDGNRSMMDSNNINQATENAGLYSKLFSKNPSLIPFKNEIMNGELNSQDKFIGHSNIDKKREVYIFNGIEAARKGLEESGINPFSMFPTVYLFAKISDRVMSQTKGAINQEKYQLIYNSCLYLAAKYESQYYNHNLFFDANNEEKLLITFKDVYSYSNDIIKLLNFDLNIVSPTEILHIYQLVDGTLENEDLTKMCRFLLTFLLFSRVFLDQEKNLVILTVYMHSKIIKFKKVNWREDLETLTGIKKEKIMKNVEQLISEIKKKKETYNLLYNSFYNII